jgi:hypothetical protein
MLAAVLGLALGPVLLSLGATGELRNLVTSSGPFVLWASLIAAQTMLWTLALPPLTLAARRHWTSTPRPDATARRDVLAAAVVLVLLVAAIPTLTHFAGAPAEFLPYGNAKVRTLTAIALFVALVAAASIWLIRGRLERLREQGATKDNLRTYLRLRGELDRLLGYLGAVVGLAVLSSAGMRRVIQDVGSVGSFHAESIVVYGVVLSLLVALVYLPTYLVAHAVGEDLRDELVPFPEPKQLSEGLEERRKLDEALGLTVSATASFRAGVAILAPLLGSLTSLLPTLGG